MEGAAGVEACAVAATACSGELELGEERCEESSASSPPGACSMELACGRRIELDVATEARAWLMRFGSSRCERGEVEGLLDCECASEASVRTDVVVIGADAACRPVVDFCMSEAPPEYDGDEQCFLNEAISNEEGCERLVSCVLPVRVDEARVGFAEPRYANCMPHEGGGSDCYCSTRNSLFGFWISGESDEAACQSSLRNCDREATLELTGPATCEPTSSDSPVSTACNADLDCTESATVDGREIVAKGRLLVTCGRAEEGSSWWCGCASDQKTMRFELGAAEVDASEACRQAPAFCIESLPVQFGPYGGFVPAPEPLP